MMSGDTPTPVGGIPLRPFKFAIRISKFQIAEQLLQPSTACLPQGRLAGAVSEYPRVGAKWLTQEKEQEQCKILPGLSFGPV